MLDGTDRTCLQPALHWQRKRTKLLASSGTYLPLCAEEPGLCLWRGTNVQLDRHMSAFMDFMWNRC